MSEPVKQASPRDISRHIWDTKYRYRDGSGIRDRTVEDTWRRVARALAGAEIRDRTGWEERFYELLADYRFLPGGRILAGAGVDRRVTLFNCFVMGPIEDRMDGIFDALKAGAITMQEGGGIGCDFSTLRPRGTPTHTAGGIASGPVSFMRIWDSMCATILSTGARRGAMMATLRCDHPDVEAFIDAKRDPRALRNFNLSVLVSDAFMRAVESGADWPLRYPAPESPPERPAPGPPAARAGPSRVYRVVPARHLWHRIMRAAYDHAEPGVLFIDQINRENNLAYREELSATNPCGEVPLPPFGACTLGSINLTRFVRAPFTPGAGWDTPGLLAAARTATRFLDDVVSASRFPLAAQARQARGTRRIGLGLTGLADALLMLGIDYGTAAARREAAAVTRRICHAAYATSIRLAEEKGPFPFLDRDRYLQSRFVRRLPRALRAGIRERGIRNSHLIAIAPAGTISLLAGNVSSGIEPIFEPRYRRRILQADETHAVWDLTDYACARWQEEHGPGTLPPRVRDARTLSPNAHLEMQAAVQPYVDNAISKTINVPPGFGFAAFESLYAGAHRSGLKGCTVFRDNPVTGAVLARGDEDRHCCALEREAD